MYIQVTETMFKDAFRNADRLDNFSYDALGLLFEYFEQLEDDTGEPIQMDVVGICCEFQEAEEEEIRDNYSLDNDDDVREFLEENTLVVGETSNGFVFLTF